MSHLTAVIYKLMKVSSTNILLIGNNNFVKIKPKKENENRKQKKMSSLQSKTKKRKNKGLLLTVWVWFLVQRKGLLSTHVSFKKEDSLCCPMQFWRDMKGFIYNIKIELTKGKQIWKWVRWLLSSGHNDKLILRSSYPTMCDLLFSFYCFSS